MTDVKYFESLARQVFSLARGLPVTVRIQKKEGLLARYSQQGIHQNTLQDLFSYTVELLDEDTLYAEESTDVSKEGVQKTVERLLSNLPFPRKRESRAMDPRHIFGEEHPVLPEKRSAHEARALKISGMTLLPLPQKYRIIKDDFPLDLGQVEQAAEGAIEETILRLRHMGASAHGYYSAFRRHFFVANSAGLSTYHRMSSCRFAATVSKGLGKGYATFFSPNPKALQIQKVLTEASRLAEETSQKEWRLGAGDYECIFAPRALLEFLSLLWKHFDAKLVHEKRSILTGKIGQGIASKAVSLEDNAYGPGQSGLPFDAEGSARRRIPLIRKGKLTGLLAGRGLRCSCHKQPTGHATRGLLEEDIFPQNLVMEGGPRPWRTMLASLKRGIFINKIWYHQLVHEKDLVVTGTATAGTCYLEKGKILGRVTRLRYQDSLLRVLAQAVETSRERALIKDGEYGSALLPYLKTRMRFEPA